MRTSCAHEATQQKQQQADPTHHGLPNRELQAKLAGGRDLVGSMQHADKQPKKINTSKEKKQCTDADRPEAIAGGRKRAERCEATAELGVSVCCITHPAAEQHR
jgi:hypothetical protein